MLSKYIFIFILLIPPFQLHSKDEINYLEEYLIDLRRMPITSRFTKKNKDIITQDHITKLNEINNLFIQAKSHLQNNQYDASIESFKKFTRQLKMYSNKLINTNKDFLPKHLDDHKSFRNYVASFFHLSQCYAAKSDVPYTIKNLEHAFKLKYPFKNFENNPSFLNLANNPLFSEYVSNFYLNKINWKRLRSSIAKSQNKARNPLQPRIMPSNPKKTFDEGIELYQRSKYPQAMNKFIVFTRSKLKAKALYWIAKCWGQLGNKDHTLFF